MRPAAIGFVVALQAAGAPFTPARAVSVSSPDQPPNALAGGEVVLGVTVADTGQVSSIRTLRAGPPFTELVIREIEQWRFAPATMAASRETARPVASDVLVAAIFRPPTLYDLPNSSRAGGVPVPRSGSDAMPYPTRTVTPLYPPRALFDGVAVVEAAVTAQGSVSEASVVAGGAGFAGAALDAARQWRFHPATQGGRPVASYAYLIFGFRQPVTAPRLPV